MSAKPAEFCEGRSKCGPRKSGEKHDPRITITTITVDDVGPDHAWAVGEHKILTTGSWHGLVFFCPFCGRPLSWSAGFRARLSGADKRRVRA